jgi:ribosomal protein S18 acetylase RimI-like enzyme
MSANANNDSELIVRPFEPRDLAKADALDEIVAPYVPGDEADVAVMHDRAEAARLAADRWAPVQANARFPERIMHGYEEAWVAVTPATDYFLVGMVAVRNLRLRAELAGLQVRLDWLARGHVLELTQLRVAEQYRRRGIGRRLCLAALDWARSHGFKLVVLNTTTPQRPARALYESLGFSEAGVCYVGRYELVWYEIEIDAVPVET